MARPLDLRRTLLVAVDAFLEASPASLAKARRLIARCRSHIALRHFTLDDVVWGGLISALTDSLFYENPTTLRAYRSLLTGASHEIHRTYLNYDFDYVFTPDERMWLTTLHDMLDFLSGFPFPDQDAALHKYEQRVEAITHAMDQSPPPERLEDETIYHLILREVSAILINVDLRYGQFRAQRLAPRSPYGSFAPQPKSGRDSTPDLSGDLDWARRALRAITEQEWLLLTWHVTPTHYQLSLH